MGKIKDISGQRFGRLVAIKSMGYRSSSHNFIWECLCDCGNKTIVIKSHLFSNHTKSCGCLQKEQCKKGNTKHGLYNSRFYSIYRDIKRRCKDTNNKNYGGRGIKNEWKSFEEFLNDMFENYKSHINEFGKKDTTIDRIDVNGNYSKENCRWATIKVQQRNRRDNHILEYLGERKTMTEFSEQYNIHFQTLRSRIISGLSVEKALNTPVKSRNI
jgi:hypothetical protein